VPSRGRSGSEGRKRSNPYGGSPRTQFCIHGRCLDMPNDFILVKRYGRSRLYDTFHAQYVTVSDLQEWLRRRISFIVVDTETGADVTDVLLANAKSSGI
jgi:hypothetical protein